MNAIMTTSSSSPAIPESAPFSPAQRAWLNGFLAGLFGAGGGGEGAGMSLGAATAEAEDFPWHDPALEMEERLALAEGRPFERKLMAAMAQLDCGQCGYLCQTYAEALASGKETSTSLCVPGAKPTTKKVKELLADRPADSIPAPSAEAAAPAAPPAYGMPVLVA
jgi:sulfite reductase (NADPH) flavoprotein alpha-component